MTVVTVMSVVTVVTVVTVLTVLTLVTLVKALPVVTKKKISPEKLFSPKTKFHNKNSHQKTFFTFFYLFFLQTNCFHQQTFLHK